MEQKKKTKVRGPAHVEERRGSLKLLAKELSGGILRNDEAGKTSGGLKKNTAAAGGETGPFESKKARGSCAEAKQVNFMAHVIFQTLGLRLRDAKGVSKNTTTESRVKPPPKNPRRPNEEARIPYECTRKSFRIETL